jgi:predicted dehydrogenase
VLRKGLAPELELHGTEASLALDRLGGRLLLARPEAAVETLETVPDPGFGNRFEKHVFPAIRGRAAGEATDHPGLDDGWRVQLFIDAAAQSAQRGGWVELAEPEAQGGLV